MSHFLFIGSADASFLHRILAAAITLTVPDVFICTKWFSLPAFAAWGTRSLDVPPQWTAFFRASE